MRQKSIDSSDYEPSNHSVDGKAVLSGFTMLLVCFIAMILAG